MVRDILKWPARGLAEKALPVEKFDEALRLLAADLVETMRHHDGWGLAAAQVDVPLRVCCVSARPDARAKEATVLTLVNPVIVMATGDQRVVEGCLSIPDEAVRVRRRMSVRVAAHDVDGNPITFEASGMGAAVLQHEVDHLDGTTIADRLPFGSQKKLWEMLREAQKLRAKQRVGPVVPPIGSPTSKES